MVSFNKIQKMIDEKWFVKGICFKGDELPLDLNGEEIACGSEIYEVDTGKIYFYFRYEWSNNGSSGSSFRPIWINKDLLDFSGGRYKYIYPTSIEEFRQVAKTENIGVLTGIKYSNELLPNFIPQVADFSGASWYQYAFGNIILCVPDISDDTIYWTVTYYEGTSEDGYSYIDSETVENGMYPQYIPEGYTWEIYPGDVQIFSDQDFYGQPEEEEIIIPYRYPINVQEYIDGSYSGESDFESSAMATMYMPQGVSLGDGEGSRWNSNGDGDGDPLYYTPNFVGIGSLYYYPTIAEEYYNHDWTGLICSESEPIDEHGNVYDPGVYEESEADIYLIGWEWHDQGFYQPEYGTPGESTSTISSIRIGNETFYPDSDVNLHSMVAGNNELITVNYTNGAGHSDRLFSSDEDVIEISQEDDNFWLIPVSEGNALLTFELYDEVGEDTEEIITSFSVEIVVTNSGDEPIIYSYNFIDDAEDSTQIPNHYSTYQGRQNGEDEEFINTPELNGWLFSNWVYGPDDIKFARYEIESEYPVYYFINDSEDSVQVPNFGSAYFGCVVGSDGEEVNWAEHEASENCPDGWIFDGWNLNGDTGDYYAIYSDGSSEPDEESDAWNSSIVGSLHDGSNEITLSPDQWVRYSFTTPSDLSALICYSEFTPRDVKCILFDDQGHVLTAEDDAYNGEEEDLIPDFYLEYDQVEPNSYYYFALYLYTSEEEPDIASGTIYIETPV